VYPIFKQFVDEGFHVFGLLVTRVTFQVDYHFANNQIIKGNMNSGRFHPRKCDNPVNSQAKAREVEARTG